MAGPNPNAGDQLRYRQKLDAKPHYQKQNKWGDSSTVNNNNDQGCQPKTNRSAMPADLLNDVINRQAAVIMQIHREYEQTQVCDHRTQKCHKTQASKPAAVLSNGHR